MQLHDNSMQTHRQGHANPSTRIWESMKNAIQIRQTPHAKPCKSAGKAMQIHGQGHANRLESIANPLRRTCKSRSEAMQIRKQSYANPQIRGMQIDRFRMFGT